MKKILFFIFSLPLLTNAQYLYYNKMNLYYNGTNYENYSKIKFKDYYSYDSIMLVHKVKSVSKIVYTTKNNQEFLKSHRINSYDSLARAINTRQYSSKYSYTDNSVYNDSAKTIVRKGNRNYSENRYNENNNLVYQFYEYRKRNNKVYLRGLSRYHFNDSGKILLRESNFKKDTFKIFPNAKYYYQNDTGQLEKKEYYKKGKLSKTYIYDCGYMPKIKPISKDSAYLCNNKTMDADGSITYTYINFSQGMQIKEVYKYNASKQLINRFSYVLKDDKELLTEMMVKSKDTILVKSIKYNKSYKKIKTTSEQINVMNSKGKVYLSQLSYQIKNNKPYTSLTVYDYLANGLLRQTMSENHNSKGKLIFKERCVYSYEYF